MWSERIDAFGHRIYLHSTDGIVDFISILGGVVEADIRKSIENIYLGNRYNG